LIVLAEHYYKKGKLSEAIAQCQRAISLQPQAAVAYKILGEVLQLSGKLEEAKRCYFESIRNSTKFWLMFWQILALCSHSSTLAEAIYYYQEAVDLKPHVAEFYRKLGKISSKLIPQNKQQFVSIRH
jgi:tetratricopeptide (TPR) repeat protein